MGKYVYTIALAATLFAAPLTALAGLTCPPMPSAVTTVDRDVKLDISGSIGKLGPVRASDIGLKTEVFAKGLFTAFPNADKLFALQTMSATYCSMLASTSIGDAEKLDRWEGFQKRVLDLMSGQTSSECSPGVLKNQLLHAGRDSASVVTAAARNMRERFRVQDFECVSNISGVLIEVDQDNGHALYYSGEVFRVKAKTDPQHSDYFRERMRESYFRYLAVETRLRRAERGGNAEACYAREKGYCSERTAWISHLMAIDYYQQARESADIQIKRQRLQRASHFLQADLKFGGFDQIVPSVVLDSEIKQALALRN